MFKASWERKKEKVENSFLTFEHFQIAEVEHELRHN